MFTIINIKIIKKHSICSISNGKNVVKNNIFYFKEKVIFSQNHSTTYYVFNYKTHK